MNKSKRVYPGQVVIGKEVLPPKNGAVKTISQKWDAYESSKKRVAKGKSSTGITEVK
jgi:hypothetical protein